jgi:xanthine dehydrogenase accessory factor
MELTDLKILIKGGGEAASAIAHKLCMAHFNVCITEIGKPTAVSRGVSFSEAVYDGEKEVEGVTARLVNSIDDVYKAWKTDIIPVVIDEKSELRTTLLPDVIIDAIMAKRNLGTTINDAPLVIGLGPGFYAGKDVHIVIETNNSEDLGKVLFSGTADEDTGIPIPVQGLTFERAYHAAHDGLFITLKEMGDRVKAGDLIATVDEEEVRSQIDGIVRALLRNNIYVQEGTKLAEIDPVADPSICYCIRARMRTIAGGVLEAILNRFNTR